MGSWLHNAIEDHPSIAMGACFALWCAGALCALLLLLCVFTPITKDVIGIESGGGALLALLAIIGTGSSMASAALALKIRSCLGQSSPNRWFMTAVFTVLTFFGVAFVAPMFLRLIERVL